MLSQSLAAQGLQFGQGLHPSLQALVGNSQAFQNQMRQPQAPEGSKAWLANASMGGYGGQDANSYPPRNNGPM
jgi:hypothetical protein